MSVGPSARQMAMDCLRAELQGWRLQCEEMHEALVAIDKTLFIGSTFTDAARMRLAIESAHGISSAALASGTEARQRQDREDGPDPKGDGPVPQEDAHD